MKRYAFITLILLIVCARSFAEAATKEQPESEVRSFELTLVAPPIPALKYQFGYMFLDRVPGNGAPLYLDAVLLLKPGTQDKADEAWKAYEAKDLKTFDKLADELEMPEAFTQLEQAGRCTECDFNPTVRQTGVMTLLPHLGALLQGPQKTIRVRALRQIEQGKIDDALKALRLGYLLGSNINEPTLVSGLVSARATQWMNETVAELLSHPKSPNLYWALCNVPGRRAAFQIALDSEPSWIYLAVPTLKRARAGEALSADEWKRILLKEMAGIFEVSEARTKEEHAHRNPISDASPALLEQARAYYAKAHELKADQASKTDPAIVLGEYYYKEYQVAADNLAKLRGLSYPQLLSKMDADFTALEKLRKEQPSNPFLEFAWGWHKAAWTFAKVDRQIAGLTAVEALRSYAAANGGALPKSLDDVTETPVPENPATGKAFEYRVENNVATLSDTKSEATLTYKVKIRK